LMNWQMQRELPFGSCDKQAGIWQTSASKAFADPVLMPCSNCIQSSSSCATILFCMVDLDNNGILCTFLN
jgi:hypothetical protein